MAEKRNIKQKLVRWSAILGVVIFVFILYKIGPEEIWRNITKISVTNFLILLGLRVLYWMLRTLCWNVIFDAYEGKISFFHLFTARMTGHAVSQLTPTAQVGSEATRIMMARCSSRKVSVASVIVDKTVEFLAVVFFTIIGVVGVFFRIVLPPAMKTIFIVGCVFITILVILLFYKQKRGLLGWIADLLGKLPFRLKFLEKNREKIEETDLYISQFYKNHPKVFVKAFLYYSLLIMLWVVEIHVGLIYIGVPDVSLIDSFLITVLGNLAFMFPFIPGSLGIYEATYVGLFALMGMAAGAAITLVLIRRVIALLLAALGLLGMIKPANKPLANQ